jgi:PAS domain S-box-containing protein
MPTLQRSSEGSPSTGRAPLWHRLSSFSVLVLAIGLSLLSLKSDIFPSRASTAIVISLLIALVCALFLHTYALLEARKKQRETDSAFYVRECESSSIFQNVLDGILILDDHGICTDANPAAFAILGVDRNQLLGHSIAKFYSNPNIFSENWASFLERKYQRGNAELIRGDRSPLIVDYTASANYIPGRHVVILCDVTQRVYAEQALKKSEERFQQMANHIQEVFWMLNAETKEIVYVSKAYETIAGRPLSEIYENPFSYQEVIHSEDRARFLAKLEEAGITGKFDEEFRIVRPDGVSRWVWSKGSPVRDTSGVARWLVGIAQDITSRKNAELQIAQHLAAAEAARAEADALRKASLTLTQTLKMDTLLDTLLETLLQVIPYDQASVMLAESDLRLMVAREAPRRPPRRAVLTLDARDNQFLQDVLVARKSIYLEDSLREPQWRQTPALANIRSWLCVPLVASDHVIGLLSLGSSEPARFTREHLRLAKSLALSAAVAIQNARLYERAEIYASELELKLKELKEAQTALEQTQSRSRGTGN